MSQMEGIPTTCCSTDNKAHIIERIENDFTYHRPSPSDAMNFVRIREFGKSFAKLIVECSPSGREQSVALTKIEEAVMWANAGIARQRPPAVQDYAPSTEGVRQ